MNFFVKLLRRGRVATFPTVFASALEQLSVAATADALVSAAEYCLSVRTKGDVGRLVASSIEDPSQLTKADAEDLYFSLEELYFGATRFAVDAPQMKAMAARLGAEFAQRYRDQTEGTARKMAIGYGVLMLRLLAKIRTVPSSVIEPIQARLFAAVRDIDAAVDRRGTMSRAIPSSSGIAWSPEVAGYIRRTARVIAWVNWEASSKGFAQELVDNLNRNVLAEAERMKPGPDWSAWTHEGRVFRVSPDGTQARELVGDEWQYVTPAWVRAHARPGTAR